MKINIFTIALIAIVFVLSSCEKAIEIDDSNFEKKLVVNGIIDNGNCILYLTHNVSTLASDSIIYVEGAICSINNVILGESNEKYSYDFLQIEDAEELNLKITKTGFVDATARALIPAKPQFSIMSAKRVTNTKYRWDDSLIQLTIQLNDVIRSTSDIYMIELLKTKMALDVNYKPETGIWEKKMKRYIWPDVFYVEDNSAEIISNGGLDFRLNKTEFTLEDDMVTPYAWIIADKNFEGKNKVLTLYCQQDFHWTNFEIRVSTINSGYYEFIQSVAAYNFNSGMFNEPVRIKSNINGGLGYFGIKKTVADSIKISDIN